MAAVAARALLHVLLLSSVCAHVAANCNRAQSREVRHLLKKYVYSQVTKAGLRLPLDCRLHDEHDMYRDQEEHKRQLRHDAWKCDYCGKQFRGEHFLDKHFDNRHSNKTHGSVCLGDYADALHAREVKHAEINVRPAESPEVCVKATMSRRSLLCQNLFSKCFPANLGDVGHRMRDFFVATLCEAHTCDASKKRELLLEFTKSNSKHAGWVWAVLSTFLVLIVLVIYGFLLLVKHAHGGFANTDDLRRRKGRSKRTQGGNINQILKALGLKLKTY